MTIATEDLPKEEPPSHVPLEEYRNSALVDRVMAIAHVPDAAHVAVIGHGTLPLLLALMRHGCSEVCSLRPIAPAPDCEITDLVWIVDTRGDKELDDALRVARSRVGKNGRVVVEGAACGCHDGLEAVCRHAAARGLDVVSFDRTAARLLLAVRVPQSVAA